MHTSNRFLLAVTVRARHRIADTPLAKHPGDARRGDIGDVVDVAAADNLVFVDFGGGAIACAPDEIALVTESPRSRFRVN